MCHWTGLSTPQVEWGFGLLALDLMSSLRDWGMICSFMFRGDSDYQCTHCSADVLGFNREVGNVWGM